MKLFGKRSDQNQVKNDAANQESVTGSDLASGADPQVADTSNAQTPTNQNKSYNSQKVNNKKILMLLAVVVVAALLVLAWLRRTDITDFVSGNSCDRSVIDKHNKAVRSVDNFANSLKTSSLEVESKPGYTENITCVYIVYEHYAYLQDVNKTRELLNTFKALQQKGDKIDKRILDQKTYEQMEMYVKSLEHNRDIGDKSDGSG